MNHQHHHLEGETEGEGIGGEGGRGRGGEGGRGSVRGRGRARGNTRGRQSTIPWVSTTPESDLPPQTLLFRGNAGPRLDLPDDPQPLDFFRQLVGDDILHLIVDETNRCGYSIHTKQIYIHTSSGLPSHVPPTCMNIHCT